MSSPTPLTLTMPSRMDFLPVARRFVESVGQAGQLEAATLEAIVLAVHEAASNVIRHAHHCQPEQLLSLQCQLLPDGIEVWLFDQGQPFDLAQVPPLDPAELRPGGRGVFLMRSLLDELTCYPRPTGGNALRMVKRAAANRSESAEA